MSNAHNIIGWQEVFTSTDLVHLQTYGSSMAITGATIKKEVENWLHEYIGIEGPDWVYGYWGGNFVAFMFVSEEKALHFKLVWG